MKTIINNSFDPFFNLALEEYLLKKTDTSDDFFYLWRNKKCVVIGRNQNPFNEIDIDYASLNNIDVLRRSTGGGAVYHDKGNINYTFITTKVSERLHNYEYFLATMIKVLNKFGIKARFVPKTHIYVGEYKVSGNAQTYYKNKMIHHGTLLFDVDLNHLENVLNKKVVIDTFAIASVPSAVINLKDVIDEDIAIDRFMNFIIEEVGLDEKDLIELTQKQLNEINELVNRKYNTWEWIYGQTPKFTVDKNEYHFEIHNGMITKSSHYKEYILGVKYDKEVISRVLEHHVDKNKIIGLLFT